MRPLAKPVAVRERPILFSAPMVRALLAGTKTQTRRIVKPQPEDMTSCVLHLSDGFRFATEKTYRPFAHGGPGDRLWVKETWQPLWATETMPPHGLKSPDGWKVGYIASDGVQEWYDCDEDDGVSTACKPSIFMPRWASRIDLEITKVRVERLHEITEADAKAEGVERDTSPCDHSRRSCDEIGCLGPTHRANFAALWEAINGDRASWKSNPWVWVVEFRRLRP